MDADEVIELGRVSRVTEDGQVVDFGFFGSEAPVLRFDVRSLTSSRPRNPPVHGTSLERQQRVDSGHI